MVWQGMFTPAAREIDPEREEELRLAAQARGGSDWALSALVARYQPTVVRYLVRLTGMPDRAAPLAERIFVRMGKRLRGPHGGEQLRLWLLRAATEAGLDVLRHPNRPAPPRLTAPEGPVGLLAERVGENGVGRVVAGWAGRLRGGAPRKAPSIHEFAWDDQPTLGRVGAWSGVADEALSPREIVRNRMIRAVLAELAYSDAQCLALHLVAGLNQNEVALALGVTPNVARRRIVQGLQLFGKRFDAAQANLGVNVEHLEQPEAQPRPAALPPRPALEPAWRSGFGMAAGDTVPLRPPAAGVPASGIAAAGMAPAAPVSTPLAPAAFVAPALGNEAGHPPLVPVPAWTAPTMPLPGGSTTALPAETIVEAEEVPADLVVDAFAGSAAVAIDDPIAAAGRDVRPDSALAESLAGIAGGAELVEAAEADTREPAEPARTMSGRVTVVPEPGAREVVWPEPAPADESELAAGAMVDPRTIVDADIATPRTETADGATNAGALSPMAARQAPPEAPRLPLAIVIADIEAPRQIAVAADIDLRFEPVAIAVTPESAPMAVGAAHRGERGDRSEREDRAQRAAIPAPVDSTVQMATAPAPAGADPVEPGAAAVHESRATLVGATTAPTDSAFADGTFDTADTSALSAKLAAEPPTAGEGTAAAALAHVRLDGAAPSPSVADNHPYHDERDPADDEYVLLLESEHDEPRAESAAVEPPPAPPDDLPLAFEAAPDAQDMGALEEMDTTQRAEG